MHPDRNMVQQISAMISIQFRMSTTIMLNYMIFYQKKYKKLNDLEISLGISSAKIQGLSIKKKR
jgi:uncharacterized membrane protein